MVRNRLYISKYDRNINSTWYDYKTTLSRLIRRLENFNSIWYDYKRNGASRPNGIADISIPYGTIISRRQGFYIS